MTFKNILECKTGASGHKTSECTVQVNVREDGDLDYDIWVSRDFFRSIIRKHDAGEKTKTLKKCSGYKVVQIKFEQTGAKIFIIGGNIFF